MTFDKGVSKAELVEAMNEKLTVEPLDLFADRDDGLRAFGLIRKDMTMLYNVSDYTADKWIDEFRFEIVGRRSVEYYHRVSTICIYSIPDILDAVDAGKIKRKETEKKQHTRLIKNQKGENIMITNANTKQDIINIFFENKRYNNLRTRDMWRFFKDHFDENIPYRTKRDDLLERLKKYLTPETLNVFANGELYAFGLYKGDISELFNITLTKVNQFITHSRIGITGEVEMMWVKKSNAVYSIADILAAVERGEIEKKEKKERKPRAQKPDIEPTTKNIAEALYIVNKSAKTSRDTKKQNKYGGDRRTYRRCDTRMQCLYGLKDAVIEKMMSEGRAKYLGINRQVLGDHVNYLKLYEICDFTFHVPMDEPVNEKKIKGELLSDITELISAERTRDVSMDYNQAMKLLQTYSGVDAKEFSKRNYYYDYTR